MSSIDYKSALGSLEMSRTTCPMCERSYNDILKHFVLDHDIEDMSHLGAEIHKVEHSRLRQAEFAKYVSELQSQRAKGTISADDYRNLVTKWFSEHQ